MEDYALISRFVEPTSGQWLVVTSGLHRFGTAACAELLSDRNQIQLLVMKAPQGWEKLNMQLVIATNVLQKSSGRPRIIESYFWRR
jgi:hypothetical protein